MIHQWNLLERARARTHPPFEALLEEESFFDKIKRENKFKKKKKKGEKKKEGHEAEETRLKNPSLPADDTAALCLTVSKRGDQRFAK